MANQNKLILTLMSFLLLSCFEDKRVDYQVRHKCIVKDNPNFSSYQYFIGLNAYDMIDSANKFNIGDDVRMYSKSYGRTE
jgi:hypothetical protein